METETRNILRQAFEEVVSEMIWSEVLLWKKDCSTYFPTASQSLADEYALGLFCWVSVAAPPAPPAAATSPSAPDGPIKGKEND